MSVLREWKKWATAAGGATVLSIALLGSLAGAGGYTVATSGAVAYLSDDPKACADCHMPYLREGAIKVSDHHVRSPLLNVSRACQVCHRYPEPEILARVQTIQDRTHDLLIRTEDAVLALMASVQKARAAGIPDEKLETARKLHRRAQWRLDFVAAENSMGFHAPGEAARLLAEAIDFARQGQLEGATAKK